MKQWQITNRQKGSDTMADTKEDKTQNTKTDTENSSKTEQSDVKNEKDELKDEQSNNKSDQSTEKPESDNSSTTVNSNGSTSDSESVNGTIPLGNVGSATETIDNGSTSQSQSTNKEVDTMADKIITKNSDGKFDYSNSKTYHTVKGDTLFGVAQDHKVAMQQLRYFNGLRKGIEELPVGINIHIPNGYVDVPTGE